MTKTDIEGLCGLGIVFADVRSAFGGRMENDIGLVLSHKLGDGIRFQQVQSVETAEGPAICQAEDLKPVEI